MNGAKVAFEEWHVWVQTIAFIIIFSAFCVFSIKAFLMKKEREQELASMPLDDPADEKKNIEP
jgi:hypothetical protein